MSANEEQQQFRLGFLSAVEVPDHGFMGGLLVTNHLGRPLEFQCTTPVKPNRTQEILYGPTLVPFLLSDLIGRTLVEKAAVKPDLILTEQEEILELRNHVSVPVACLADSAPGGGPPEGRATFDESNDVIENAGASAPAAAREAARPVEGAWLGRQRLQFHDAHQSDRSTVALHASAIPRDADLREPFQRVREALSEALQPGTKR